MYKDFPDSPVAKTLRSQCRGPGFNPWSGNLIPYAATKSSHAATKTWHSQIDKYFLKKEEDFWWALKLEKQALRPHNMEQCPRFTPGLITAIDAGPSITDAGQWSLPAGPLSPLPLKAKCLCYLLCHVPFMSHHLLLNQWRLGHIPAQSGGATGNMNFYLTEPWTYDMGNSPNSKVISGSRHPKAWQRVTTLFYFTF